MGKVKLKSRENSSLERIAKRQRKSFENTINEAIVTDVSAGNTKNTNATIINEQLISDVNDALLRATNYGEKIEILTTLPTELSIRQMRTYFNVSRRMASRAKKLRKTDGYKSRPKKRKGNKMNPEIVEKAKCFYLSEEASRIMPGKKTVFQYQQKQGV